MTKPAIRQTGVTFELPSGVKLEFSFDGDGPPVLRVTGPGQLLGEGALSPDQAASLGACLLGWADEAGDG